ncbi:unnamed protein product, partial [Mesorhabditis spiculigera]
MQAQGETLREVAERYRKLSEGSGGDMTLPTPLAPGALGEKLNLWTNYFKINVVDTTKVYRYNVDVTASRFEDIGDVTKTHLILTREPVQGGLRLVYREICSNIVRHCFSQEAGLPNWATQIFYDQHRLLYIMGRRIDDGNGCITATYNLPKDRLYHPFKVAKLDITFSGEMTLSEAAIAQLSGSIAGFKDQDSASGFIEVSLSKSCFDQSVELPSEERKYLCYSKNRIFMRKPQQAQDENLPEMKQLLLGSKKSVELIAGSSGRPEMALNFDAEKGCFLKPGPVIEIATNITHMKDQNAQWRPDQIDMLHRVLKGVLVSASYGDQYRTFRIDRIMPTSARAAQFQDKDGKTWTIEAYFKDRRGATLNWPLAPLAELKRGGHKSHFPLEFLTICEGHVVATAKQTPEIMKTFVKSAAMVPEKRQDAIMHLIREQEVGRDLIADARYQVDTRQPLEVTARLIPRPLAVYSNQNQAPIAENGTWRKPNTSSFLRPMEAGQWAFFVLSDRSQRSFDANAFTNGFRADCLKRGIKIPECGHMGSLESGKLEWAFENLKSGNFTFALFAMDDQLKMQDELKYMERKYQITTQNIKLSTATRILTGKQAATMENIVQKFNVKLGGQNFAIRRQAGSQFTNELHNGNVFVFGIGPVEMLKDLDDSGYAKMQNLTLGGPKPAVSGPVPPMASDGMKRDIKPFVLSYAGNFGREPGSFIGDFLIKQADVNGARTSGGLLLEAALDTLKNCSGRTTAPTRFVIYRSGTTDWDVQDILENEIPRMQTVISQTIGAQPFKLTYILAHKDHNVRFFRKNIDRNQSAAKNNVGPGTVVDSNVINPNHRQFFLNAHTALQGTAKAPKYTVIYDNANLSMDDLQAMTYDLCYMHQIVNLPTALPSPLRIAAEYGDRGRRIFAQYLKTMDDSRTDFNRDLEYRFADVFKLCRINA